MTDNHGGGQFAVPAESYDRMMGRYLPTLAPAFADAAGIAAGMRLLDVGCGPGGLTTELVRRTGPDNVAAIDPSPSFVRACRERNPGVDVRQGVAEELPFADGSFDAALASLVVGFMTDPVAGCREMARVSKAGGTVASAFWDTARMPAVRIFWAAAATVDPSAGADLRRPGRGEGELAGYLRDAGLVDVRDGTLEASTDYADFDDWWSGWTLGVGPIGAYFRTLDEQARDTIRAESLQLLGTPTAGFTLTAIAWFARATKPATDSA